jgi:pyrrolidone-carboxylate peptidase
MLLIYAFKPFAGNKQNISQETLKKLHARDAVKKVALPVNFRSSVFLDTVEKVQPDAILGLGQYPRGGKIRIERRAKNWQGSKAQPVRNITKDRESIAFATLKLQPDTSSRLSYDAGNFVCNYSMYVLLTNPATRDIPFAFVHIPKMFALSKAVKFVEDKVDKILTN